MFGRVSLFFFFVVVPVAPLLAFALPARADEPASTPYGSRSRTARIDVDAPADCATDATFGRALARRTDRVTPAEKKDSAPSARIEVAIKKDNATRVAGDIIITQRGTRSERRRITGATCEEVTMGLSLVAALAFDPAAKIDVEPDSAATPSPAPPKNELGVAPAAPVQNTSAETVPGRPLPAEKPASSDAKAEWRWAIGAMGGAAALGATNATLAYGGFVDLEKDRTGLAPSFRLGGSRAEGSADGGLASADLAWTTARAMACPVRFDPVRTLAFRPCAGLDAGVISAHANGAGVKTSDRSRPWVAPHATLRLAWTPVRVFFVEIQGGVALPLVRDEFAVDPTISVYRAPSVVPLVEIAAGVRFP